MAAAQSVTLLHDDAVVWSRAQTIRGVASFVPTQDGILYVNGTGIPLQFASAVDTFSISVTLSDGVNTVWAVLDSAGTTVSSDTLFLTMGYRIRPDIEAVAAVNGRNVLLTASVLENPDSVQMSMHWTQHPGNPMPLALSGQDASECTAVFPPEAPSGDYSFSVTTACSDGDTVLAGALVRVDGDSVRAFVPQTDHARWIDSAIVYGVTPYIFVEDGRFPHITAKIPELAQLGITALWLQPVYMTHGGGQGYDVTDYFRIRPDLGTEAELRELVQTAHAHGLRVLLDFIPNHSSIYHPYAVHAAEYGTASHYYHFYQRTPDSAPYSQHYHTYQGFINYFWNELPNFNYDHPELQRMVLEAGKHWIEKLDIDGYRIDAAWGVNARKPEFMKSWRLALKRVKPSVFLLGEDKASWASVFDERVDAAYDWAPDISWVSEWVWQTDYSTSSNPTIFNSVSQGSRVGALRSAMTNRGTGYAPTAKILRFMENNDTFRFLATHDLARTKMVAAMMFSIAGVPLLFNGQETGVSAHPYDAFQIFVPHRTIASLDQFGLFPYYRLLCTMRKRLPALWGRNFEEVPVGSGPNVYAYRRWEGRENILGVVNLGSSPASIKTLLPVSRMDLDSLKAYFLTDQITNEVVQTTAGQMDSLALQIPGYTTRVYVIDTTTVTGIFETPAMAEIPGKFALEQNFPNPFNPVTGITYQVPGYAGRAEGGSAVRLVVYDLLGREIAVLVDEYKPPGVYIAQFDGRGLASGVYFYRLSAGNETAPSTRNLIQIRKMVLLK
ncbi:MAG: T9SS type A sorting domain-containing protein [Bacteroidetes bacterium]|nr:T9SS type A sorting domain-containing protein [Bacteroidota bacterium]